MVRSQHLNILLIKTVPNKLKEDTVFKYQIEKILLCGRYTDFDFK